MILHDLLTNYLVYKIVSGLLVKISFAVFLLGTGVRTLQFMSLTRSLKRECPNHDSRARQKPSVNVFLKELPLQYKALQHTIFAKSPVTMLVSLVFHICLFVTPLFLFAHNTMMGIRFLSFSIQATNILTAIFLLCALFFLLRRVVSARVRMITSINDYLILIITTLPFLTGFLAYYQVYDYKVMIVLHMLSGELMLVVAPFSKMFHMVFFFVNRFMIIGQHTLGKGSRVWQW